MNHGKIINAIGWWKLTIAYYLIGYLCKPCRYKYEVRMVERAACKLKTKKKCKCGKK